MTNFKQIHLQKNKKCYFASDFHLGSPNEAQSLIREKKIINWLDSIRDDAQVVMLVGDIFDFWFEYGSTVPKGYFRFFAKIAQLIEEDIEVIFFTGNHDLWMSNYFVEIFGIQIIREPITIEIIENSLLTKTLKVGHGDGLGPGDYGYKYLKKIFENPLCIWLFGWLHPRIGMKLAGMWSNSRKTEASLTNAKQFYGEDKEWILLYCKEVEKIQHHDYYVFGHRHLEMVIPFGNSTYVNLGEWMTGAQFAVFENGNLKLQYFQTP